jgi:HEAT repeat protein
MKRTALLNIVWTTAALMIFLCSGFSAEPPKKDQPAAKTPAVEEPPPELAGLIQDLKDPNPETRMNAANQLAKYGESANSAFVELLRLMKDDPASDVRNAVGMALNAIGPLPPSAVGELIKILEKSESSNMVIRILGRMGPEAEAAAPVLAKLLDKEDEADKLLRSDNLQVLVKLKVRGTASALLKQMKEDAISSMLDDYYIGYNSSIALLWPEMAFELGKLFEENDEYVRDCALRTTCAAGPKGIAELIRHLRYSDDSEILLDGGATLSDSLVRAGSVNRAAVLQFVRRLDDPDPAVRMRAMNGLASLDIAFASPLALPKLRKLLSDEDWKARAAAIAVLSKLHPDDKELIGEIIKLLDDKQREVRLAAVSALSKFGPAAKIAAPKIEQLLSEQQSNDKKDDVHAAAFKSLVYIAPDQDLFFSQLPRYLKYAGRTEWYYEVGRTMDAFLDFEEMVKKLGPTDKLPMSKVMALLESDSRDVQIAGIKILGMMGPAAKAAVPKLESFLKIAPMPGAFVKNAPLPPPFTNASAGFLRGPAIESLRKINPEGAELAIAQANMLHDEKMFFKTLGVNELLTKGPRAEIFLPEAVKLLQDDDDVLRYRIAFALGELEPKTGQTLLSRIDTLPPSNDPEVGRAIVLAQCLIRRDNAKALPELTRLLQKRNWTLNIAAARALSKMGKDAEPAVPRIIELLAKTKTFDRVDTNCLNMAEACCNVEGVAKAALPLILLSEEEVWKNERPRIVKVIRDMGPWTAPELIKLLRHEEWRVRVNAALALQEAWPDETAKAVSALIAMLQDRDNSLRWSAVDCLAAVDQEARKHVPEIAALLKHKQSDVRLAAAVALILLVPDSNSAAADLAALLRDPEPRVRVYGCTALGAIGPEAKAFAPDLAALLNDKDSEVRSAAAWALGELPPLPVGRVEDAVKMMRENAHNIRANALFVLRRSGPEAIAAARKELLGLLKNTDPAMRIWAIKSLSETWVEDKRNLPAIIDLQKDDEIDVRLAAVAAMCKLDPAGQEISPVLSKLLKGGDSRVRDFTVEALADIHPPIKSALPDLIACLRDSDVRVRRSAARAIGEFGPDAKSAIPELVNLIGRPHEQMNPRYPEMNDHDVALMTIGKLGPETGAEVVKLAQSQDRIDRIGAAQALSSIENGKNDKAVVSELIKMLKDPDGEVRINAINSVWSFGPDAKAALPDLMAFAGNDDPEVRSVAVRAIGWIGVDARTALPLLRELQNDPDESVQSRAADSIRQIEDELNKKNKTPFP